MKRVPPKVTVYNACPSPWRTHRDGRLEAQRLPCLPSQRSSASRSSWSVLACSKDSASKGQIAHGPQNHSNRAPQTRVLRFHLEAREITRPRGACAAFPYLMHILLQSRYVNARNKGDLVDDVAVSGNFSEFVWTRCTGSAGFVLSHRGHREFFCHG